MQSVVVTLHRPVAAPVAERHVLAERFKYKMCRNYVTTGACPYEIRCMFAHGEHDLRTMEMNLRDGLITEEAIKAYQRIMRSRDRTSNILQLQVPSHFAATTCAPLKHEMFMRSADGTPRSSSSPSNYSHNPYSLTAVLTYTNEDASSDDANSDEACSTQEETTYVRV